AARLEAGLDVEAGVAAYPGETFACQLSAVNPAIDPESRAITVEARCPNDGRKLRPGMFANARVLLGESVEGVYVPASALLNDPTTESTQAFVIEDGVARLRVVQAGEGTGAERRVLSGVAAGERVAALNLDQLYDGAPV